MSKRENVPALDKSTPVRRRANSREPDMERIAELERQLRLTSSKLRMALDVGKLGSWERNLETDEITGSSDFKACLGLKPDARLTYTDLQAMFHPADVERINQAVSYALRTRTDFNIEHRVLKADGSIGHVHMRGGAIYEDDKPIRFVGVLQDIKERQKIREEMDQAQRRQEFLLRLNDQLSTIDDQYQIMEIAARDLSELLKADTAGYGEVYEDRGVVIVEREWSRGLISNEGKVEKLDNGSGILKILERGQAAIINDVRADPRLGDPAVQAAGVAAQGATAELVRG